MPPVLVRICVPLASVSFRQCKGDSPGFLTVVAPKSIPGQVVLDFRVPGDFAGLNTRKASAGATLQLFVACTRISTAYGVVVQCLDK